MCRKLICLLTFIIVLGMAGNAPADLVGYWRLDEGSGTTAYDSSGNGHDGIIEGDPQWIAGMNGQALQFDGTEDYIDIGLGAGDYFSTLNSGLTVAAWINRASTGTYDIAFGAGRNPVGTAAGDDNNGWKFGIDSGDVIKFTTLGILDYTSSVGVPIGEWAHIAATFNEAGTEVQIYLDGPLVETISGNGPANPATGLYAVGFGGTWALEFFDGSLDEVRVYNNVLTEPEIVAAMEGSKGYPNALGPSPEDGALHADTWVSMSWKAGDFAVSHDVYMGENFDDVNDATHDSETFQGSTSLTYFVAGFPGYPYPDGLVPGTTYYWRIDEVNDADPNSPWKGDVWSFTVPPKTAYNPSPPDGAEYVGLDVSISWVAGHKAALHTVYFGDNFDDVNNAVGGPPLTVTTYNPGPLEKDKTYYWRVDEFDGSITHKGEVWSFITIPSIAIKDSNLVGWWSLDEGSGNIALDWSGHDNHGALLSEPQWVAGQFEQALAFEGNRVAIPASDSLTADLFQGSFTLAAWINPKRTGNTWQQIFRSIKTDNATNDTLFINNDGTLSWRGTVGGVWAGGMCETVPDVVPADQWTHVAVTGDGTSFRIYVNGALSQESAFQTTDGTNATYYLGGDPTSTGESYTGMIDDARIYNKVLTDEEIIKAMRGDPLIAWGPSPANGSTPDLDAALPLSWSPGDMASQHDVYFGTDRDAVADADTTTADIYRGRQSSTSYTPPEGVEWGGGPYYWRIDEYNTDDSISKGRIWGFTVADFILIDDFESYNAGENQIWFFWHDGLGYGAPGTANYYAGNGTGAAVGDETTSSYTEETIVHGGRQSMPVVYDNNKQDYAKYSEVELTLTNPRDWTKDGVAELSLWFRGYPGSVGSFVEGPTGTYTMTGSGTDIWDVSGIGTGYHDEFHFAYKTLTGSGSIVARVVSVENTNGWAKAGVMIRETLDADSKHAMAVVTPLQGVSFQRRNDTGGTSAADTTGGISAPHWVKIERDLSGNFAAYQSTNGSNWQMVGLPDNISMTSNVYIGLAVTSHDAALTCQAVFSNVTTTGTVGSQWAHQDIGIASNAAEPLYVAVSNAAGNPAVVVHDDPAAATIDTWTEWVIPLSAFADQGIVLTNVDRIALGLGNRGNMTVLGGSGKMFFDDIRLYRSREAAE